MFGTTFLWTLTTTPFNLPTMLNIRDLQPGATYEVIAPFTDYDGIVHAVGERWEFATTNFLPYDDGLTLHVRRQGRPLVYRLQTRPEAQLQITEDFGCYVTLVAPAP